MGQAIKIEVEVEVNPELRLTVQSGHAEHGGVRYRVANDAGCGTYIIVNDKEQFRLSPEHLIMGLHKAIVKKPTIKDLLGDLRE